VVAVVLGLPEVPRLTVVADVAGVLEVTGELLPPQAPKPAATSTAVTTKPTARPRRRFDAPTVAVGSLSMVTQ
jgi:hypothetical protein